MKIGFSKKEITPPIGIELGGYAGYRPCAGIHDPLWCKVLVVEQDQKRWALMSLDLLSIDESLSSRIAEVVRPLGIDRVIAAAIHSHASPCGIILGEGPLAKVNAVSEADPSAFQKYMEQIVANAAAACTAAMEHMETFAVRSAQGKAPVIGSERHTGEQLECTMTVIQCRTESGRTLILYQIPCHPTVLGPDNLLASADFAGGIEQYLDADMAMFLNGAAGDISTRFTRKSQSFAECDRLAQIAAEAVMGLIREVPYGQPEPINGRNGEISLAPRPVQTKEKAQEALLEATARWQQAAESGMEPGKLRILRSYVEGAGVALEFSVTMAGIQELQLPVTVFTFAGLRFATVPGEMFDSLWNLDAVPICYTNGYYRYIADDKAYEAGYYEAMAAILDRGQGEIFLEQTAKLLKQI